MRLYVAHERLLYGFIFALVHDWSATEDILQETAQIMWSKFDGFQSGTNFAAWSLRIARYQAMDYRKRCSRTSVFDAQLVEQLARQAEDYIINEEAKRHEALKRCLEKLTKRDRHLIELRYQLDTTVKDIAAKLGWHTKSVYRSLQRIRMNLFRCVQRTVALEDQR
ncbi:MAG: sigma-70 family RNA polymerase sigma factor [Planctomycetota bacterium]|jgi:RNA polymerase sigma-70 factor (ECF subfamily)|nr:sigma-70 family RNA polymerase sigma factor [Planctomycetota bacterium]